MLSRRSLFRLVAVAPPALAVALASPALVAPAVCPPVNSPLRPYELARRAMGLLGLIDLPGGEEISGNDYMFVRQFMSRGITEFELACRIKPYYFAPIEPLRFHKDVYSLVCPPR